MLLNKGLLLQRSMVKNCLTSRQSGNEHVHKFIVKSIGCTQLRIPCPPSFAFKHLVAFPAGRNHLKQTLKPRHPWKDRKPRHPCHHQWLPSAGMVSADWPGAWPAKWRRFWRKRRDGDRPGAIWRSRHQARSSLVAAGFFWNVWSVKLKALEIQMIFYI